ncbi:hypothetical protein [Pandoraea soli]|uniref:hypothetical protein n=1 Tax=Pandoraea soli TaxID=2508293 RepID=UPI00123F2F57|nr:hypothetical protein [Pandoraea soli]
MRNATSHNGCGLRIDRFADRIPRIALRMRHDDGMVISGRPAERLINDGAWSPVVPAIVLGKKVRHQHMLCSAGHGGAERLV